ncbi:MAG: beta-N-acetylhexosaminidase [Oceanococcus sp.]
MNEAVGGGLGPIMMDLRGHSLHEQEIEQLQNPSVGGVILFTRNFVSAGQIAALIKDIRALRPQLLIAADTEGGRVQRFRSGFLALPAMACFGELWADDESTAIAAATAGGWLLAAELRAIGVDLAFAPVLDIDTGVSGVIGDRAVAKNAIAVTALTAAFSRGMQAAGMATTGKHFPGHGFVAPDSHVEMPLDQRSLIEIDNCDLAPYRQLTEQALLDSVMIAHVCYPQVDDKPASISPRWIKQCLRQDMGYQGAIFSDDLSMGGLATFGDVCSRVQMAQDAGCDMLPVCNKPDDLRSLLQDRRWTLDEAASRRLRALRRKRYWNSLSELRETVIYSNNYNQLNQHIKVKVNE